jgi:hypothetical protein
MEPDTLPRRTAPLSSISTSPVEHSIPGDGRRSLSARQRRFRTWYFPTSACVMVETRLTEGMLLGRSAGLYLFLPTMLH